MRRILGLAVIIFMFTVQFPLDLAAEGLDAGRSGPSQDGGAPGYVGTVNLTVPAGRFVLRAGMNAGYSPKLGAPCIYPEGPTVSIGDDLLWAFDGTGYGAFGDQKIFSDGAKEKMMGFSNANTPQTSTIRLPKDARASMASLQVVCEGDVKGAAVVSHLMGEDENDAFGYAVAPVGDVNGDGFDDVLVGAPFYHIGDYEWSGDGKAYLFFGGKEMDNIPDLVFTGIKDYQYLGSSIAPAGDVNNDGYDDFIIGVSPWYYSAVDKPMLFLGGPNIDNIPEYNFTGPYGTVPYGRSASCAGDVNGDGYDDIVMGSTTGSTARIYFGGPTMDYCPYTSLDGVGGVFSASHVEGAGDVNGDGYDDVLVVYEPFIVPECMYEHPEFYARTWLFFGGPCMDGIPDIKFNGSLYTSVEFSSAGDVNADGFDDVALTGIRNPPPGSPRGYASICAGGAQMDDRSDYVFPIGQLSKIGTDAECAGDVNGDGYDDLIAGYGCSDYVGPGMQYISHGGAQVFFGGPGFDTVPDCEVIGTKMYDEFGGVVSGAGDVNHDGRDEFMVSAASDSTTAKGSGMVRIYSWGRGLSGARIELGKNAIWDDAELLACAEPTRNFASELNEYLAWAGPSGRDEFGNSYVDVPLKVTTGGPGTVVLKSLNITYTYHAPMPDCALVINDYISSHGSADGSDVTIPITVTSKNAGQPELENIWMVLDEPPQLCERIPDLEMEEDTAKWLLDLHQYFKDDYDPQERLNFSVEALENGSIVDVQLQRNRFIVADAMTGPQNDDWTGLVPVRVTCTDTRGDKQTSNIFNVIVTNVNDAPVIVTTPPPKPAPGTDYMYDVDAVDPDGDCIIYSLASAPPSMRIDNRTGVITWQVPSRGAFPIRVKVSDGLAFTTQEYCIECWSNTPPVVTSTPPGTAIVGLRYSYDIISYDEECDDLTYILTAKPDGMGLDGCGRIIWTPREDQLGEHTVSLVVTDGNGALSRQDFNISVLDGKPMCAITRAYSDWPWEGMASVHGEASGGRLPLVKVEVRLDDGNWTAVPVLAKGHFKLDIQNLSAGPHVVYARAYNGKYSDVTLVKLTVKPPEEPPVEPPALSAPSIKVTRGQATLSCALVILGVLALYGIRRVRKS